MAISDILMAKLLDVLRRRFAESDPAGTFMLHDFAHERGRASDALLYAAIFCPSTVEVAGSVLLVEAVEEESQRQRFLQYQKTHGPELAERSFNFVEVPYLFAAHRSDLSEADDGVLGELIAASWSAWLHHEYPGRTFWVEVLTPTETGSVVGVQFFEKRRSGGGQPSL